MCLNITVTTHQKEAPGHPTKYYKKYTGMNKFCWNSKFYKYKFMSGYILNLILDCKAEVSKSSLLLLHLIL